VAPTLRFAAFAKTILLIKTASGNLQWPFLLEIKASQKIGMIYVYSSSKSLLEIKRAILMVWNQMIFPFIAYYLPL
jgi:hypothetical protein